MRAVAVVALALCAVAAVGVMAVDDTHPTMPVQLKFSKLPHPSTTPAARTDGKRKPRIAHGIKPKVHVQYDLPRRGTTGVVTATKDYLLGKFNPATHPDFRAIRTAYGATQYVRSDAYAAYQLMNTAARNELGFDLPIVSATRTFDEENRRWATKWNTDPLFAGFKDNAARAGAIMEHSAMPSASLHHWGSSFDLWSHKPRHFTANAQGRHLSKWLRHNAARFGFCRPFIRHKSRRHHHDASTAKREEEPYHVAFKPVVKQLVAQYKAQIKPADLTGFIGSESAQAVGAVEKFVSGINPACLS